ncbi:GNAT family N-acetyltransferase [Jiulongibacter sediminis]|jgi:predicted GNAT family N-acyltransferase|uniref:GNAT family N-acetyltransferase n=1 Tax=Jiulongibacter sediminis TaxID=1605367 RepID=UPI0026E99F44|nr:GNAT family N-acetyltransferase [Jiulongibacter sediminis]
MINTEIREIAAEETWPVRHKVMWPDKPFEYVKIDNDADGQHFGLFVNGRLASIISLFIADGDAQFRKLATEVECQGKGYASQLIEHVIRVAQQQRARRVWCNARANKTSFYEKFGLQKTNETFSKGGIDFVIMELTY